MNDDDDNEDELPPIDEIVARGLVAMALTRAKAKKLREAIEHPIFTGESEDEH
jgi:hypothetical protein